MKTTSLFGSLSLIAGLTFIGIKSCIYTVQPGYRALIMDNFQGLKQNVYDQGYNFKVPIIQVHTRQDQKPILYDCRLNKIDITIQTGTKDLQTVSISLRILQQPIVQALPTIHQLLGRDYEKKVFNSIGQQVLRTIVAQYDADQLLKSRQNISKQIKNLLMQKALDFNINVEDVSFMNLGFSRQYANAVQRRAVQQQLAEMQKFIVLRDQQLKNAQVIRAQAQAQAAKLINLSVQKYGSTQIQVKKLQAAKAIAQLISNNMNITFVPTSGGNLLNFGVR